MTRAAGYGGRNATTAGGRLPATIGGRRSTRQEPPDLVTTEDLMKKIRSIENVVESSDNITLKDEFLNFFTAISGIYVIIEVIWKIGNMLGLFSILLDILQHFIAN